MLHDTASLTLALELFEYKMDDLRHRRAVRGGADSIWRLRRQIDEMAHKLEPVQRARYEALSRELGQRETALERTDPDAEVAFDDLVVGESPDLTLDDDWGTSGAGETRLEVTGSGGASLDIADEFLFGDTDEAVLLAGPESSAPPTDAERYEQQVLQRLAQRVFGREVERFAEGMAAAWRAERERITARVLYATMRNFERFRATKAFEHDANLRQFRVVEPVPDRVDPLVSLSDVDSLVLIARDVVDTVMRLRTHDPAPPIERRQSLDYLRRMALEVTKDPYAGKRSAVEPRGPDASELRSALRDLARQRLSDWQRQARRSDLERQLRERQEVERSQIAMLRRDQMKFKEYVEAFFARLEQLVPRSVGGSAEEPQLSGGVLFAVSPGLRRTDLPGSARSVTLRLAGPVRLPFAGHELAITVQGQERHLYVGDVEVPLNEDRVVLVDGNEVETFLESDYLHLRARESGGSLASRVAEAAAALHVLASAQHEVQLSVLRMLAPGAPGDPSSLVSDAIRRAGQIVGKAPDRREAIHRLMQGAARGIGSELDEGWLRGFVQRALLALYGSPDALADAIALIGATDPSAEPAAVVPFVGDPVDITVNGRTITVRRYGIRGADHLVAMLPGQVIGSFREHLVERLGAGTFICVHGAQQVVAAYLPSTTIPSRRI
ncbi:MAG: hypothetical protein U5J97_08560 [Trueperaceae bacterium]|nr:hypothetical protein [Trueperaceae bacterium]